LIGSITTLLFVVLSVAKGPVPLVGLAVGATIGGVGVTLTRFESIEGELHFTPDRYLGFAVLSLFGARLLYRAWKVIVAPASLSTLETLRSSPTMAGVLFLLLGYYLAHTAAVLVRGRRMREQIGYGSFS
jgi:hypothetical protein